jgi:hypothetical protein
MSTKLKPIKQKGMPKKIEVTRYWGGEKLGVCVQLTGTNGYVLLSKSGLEQLNVTWNEHVENFK